MALEERHKSNQINQSIDAALEFIMVLIDISEQINELEIPSSLPDSELLENYRITKSSNSGNNGNQEGRFVGELSVQKKAYQISCIFLKVWEGWDNIPPQILKDSFLDYYYLSTRVKRHAYSQCDCDDCKSKVKVIAKLTLESLHSLLKLLKIFPFSGEVYRAIGFILYKIGSAERALKCLHRSHMCYLQTNPELWDETEKFSWENPNHFYYLHHMVSMSQNMGSTGHVMESIQLFERILHCTGGVDACHICYNMIDLLIRNGQFDLAEDLATNSFGMQRDPIYLYGMLIRDFIKYKAGTVTLVQLEKSLYKAIQSPNCITIALLLKGEQNVPHPHRCALIAHNLQETWSNTPGLNDWVASMAFKDGPKPPSIQAMFSLLNHGTILIQTKSHHSASDKNHHDDDEEEHKFFATTDVALIPDTSSPTFRVPKGIKEYSNDNKNKVIMYKICMFNALQVKTFAWHDFGWVKVNYNHIESVPFWSLILTYGPNPRPCANKRCTSLEAKFICAGCGAVSFCCKQCQREEWKGGHRENCNRLAKK